MLRLWTDFNAMTKGGECWNLIYRDVDVRDDMLTDGQAVILFQDDDDFEVEARVAFRYVEEIMKDGWVAQPDWSTRKILKPTMDAAQ